MPKSHFSKICLTATLAILLLGMRPSLAQYVWLDESGVRQYSDQPPPAGTPKNKIIKAPKESAPPSEAVQPAAISNPENGEDTASASPSPTPTSTSTSTPAKPQTTAEKEADYRKKKAEQAEKNKKVAEEARRKADKSKNCARAREYQAALDSGQRIAKVNPDGERSYLSDDERAREAQDNRRALDDCR